VRGGTDGVVDRDVKGNGLLTRRSNGCVQATRMAGRTMLEETVAEELRDGDEVIAARRSAIRLEPAALVASSAQRNVYVGSSAASGRCVVLDDLRESRRATSGALEPCR
jgi:hypothetical protein